MGHAIQAFIARSEPLAASLTGLRHAHVVPLAQGYGLLPVTVEFFDEIGATWGISATIPFEEFWKLSPGLAEFARQLSRSFAIAYVETDYFGGNGTQSAIAWERGEVVVEPIRTGCGTILARGAINRALRSLGGVPRSGFLGDEFGAIGLGRFRSNEDWVERSERD